MRKAEQLTEPPERPVPSLVRVWRSGWAKIFAAVAFIVGVPAYFGTFDFFHDLVTKPALSIHLSGDSANPFSLPFKIKNVGRFTASNLNASCSVEEMRDEFNNTYKFGRIETALGYDTIEPDAEKTAACGIKMGWKILTARVSFQITYQTLWRAPQTAKRHFTWYSDASPARWVESD